MLTPSGHGHKTVLWTYRMDPNLTTLQCMARHTCTIISPCLHSTHGPTHLQRPPQHCDTSAQLHGHVTTLQVSCTPFHRPLHPQLHTSSSHMAQSCIQSPNTLPAHHSCTHAQLPTPSLHSTHNSTHVHGPPHPPCTPDTAEHTCTAPHTFLHSTHS